jgi:pimeloyl-ACP methyl ester carboxylesterase
LLLLHPNGFCAGLFDPVARELASSGRFRPFGVDLRGHGGTDAPPATSSRGMVDGVYGYVALASDVLAVVDALGVERCAVVGESLGGGVAAVVDRLRPGLFRRLMLCEAVARPIPAEPPPEGANHMAVGARRRKPVWPSRAVMIESYGARSPLDELAPEALAAYIRWGTVDRDDGQVELACPPEVEATLFESSAWEGGAPLAWDHLASLSAPAVVLAGATSWLPREWFEEQARRAGAPFHLVDGGHFFLQEDTERGVALIERFLGDGS